MNFIETAKQNIHGVCITRKDERIFNCHISIDIHGDEKSIKSEAAYLVYIQALLSGCDGYTREEFLDAINLLGASIDVSLDNGILTFSITSLKEHQKKILALFEAMLLSPTFPQKEIVRIKELIGNELQDEKEDAKLQSYELFVNGLYEKEDRRYHYNPDTLSRALADIKRSDLNLIHKKVLSHHWIFTLLSDTDSAHITITRLEKLRNHFKAVTERNAVYKKRKLANTTSILTSIPSRQNIELNIGSTVPFLLKDKEYAAFVFGLNVLGKWGGFAGRLMSTVREKEGLTYGIYAKTETFSKSEGGFWRIMTFFAPDKVKNGITSTLRELTLIHEKGITDSEYKRFKTIIETGEALLGDSILRKLADIHAFLVKGFTLEEIHVFKESFLSVTKSEVNGALKKYIDPKKLIISAAGPVTGKEKEFRSLGRIEKTKK